MSLTTLQSRGGSASPVSDHAVQTHARFIAANSRNGVYSAELGLGALLYCIAREPRALAIESMESAPPTGSAVLYRKFKERLTSINYRVGRAITLNGFRNQFNYPEIDAQGKRTLGDSALLTLGFVDKEYEYAHGKMSARYSLTQTGKELAIPMIRASMRFVEIARASGIPHRHDSMVRIFESYLHSHGLCNDHLFIHHLISEIANGEPTTISKLTTDLSSKYPEINITSHRVNKAVHKLRQAGMINYSVRARHHTYALRSIAYLRSTDEEIFTRLKSTHVGDLSKDFVSAAMDSIAQNPGGTYNSFEIIKRLHDRDHSRTYAVSMSGRVLLGLLRAGVLSETGGFHEHQQSMVTPNGLTKAFDKFVLEPATRLAETLDPDVVPNGNASLDSEKTFLRNYLEENR